MSQQNENLVLKAALEYHNQGWCTIPIRAGTKRPAIRSWEQYQLVRPDVEQLKKWFSCNDNQIAVICGKVSGGLTCRDFDDMDSYEQWANKYPELAKMLPTVQTSRGRHIYFISDLGKIKKLGDGELRGNGYCLLPPSIHPSGSIYQWLIQPNGELPELSLTDFTEEAEEREEQHPPFIASISSASSVSSVSSVKERVIFYENLDEKAQCYVNTAIKHTLPYKKGYRNFLIFLFCRWLKGCVEFEKCKAGQLKPLVRLWHEKALQTIGTKPFDETWADFCYGWTRVKYPKGNGISLKIAVQNAMKVQNHLAAEGIYEKPEVKLLVRICFELQALQKTEPIWLSESDGALIFNVTRPTIGKWLSMLEADGIIKKVAEHTALLATRYKFIAN